MIGLWIEFGKVGYNVLELF